MCRSIAEGGRRCPAHSNPERIKAYNAIRRARYAAQKATTAATPPTIAEIMTDPTIIVTPETSHIGEIVDNAATPTSISHPMFSSKLFENDRKEASLYTTKGITREQQQLNISSQENEGYLVDHEFFTRETISGVINYNNLNEESYKEFGFKDVVDKNGNFVERQSYTSLSTISELSEQELQTASDLEKASLTFFTSNNYEWVNKILYRQEGLPYKDNGGTFLSGIMSEVENRNVYNLEPHQRCKASFKHTVETIDSALDKGPKRQRIVYRGMSKHNQAFENAGYENATAWADDNIKIGAEIRFDGFQSSTVDFRSAKDYAGQGDGGIIYEILTPEGVNVTSVSCYDHEKEVLLPRNSRYMVVGKHKAQVHNSLSAEKCTIVQMVAINDNGAILDGTNSNSPAPIEIGSTK